jgi:hypothetical protein
MASHCGMRAFARGRGHGLWFYNLTHWHAHDHERQRWAERANESASGPLPTCKQFKRGWTDQLKVVDLHDANVLCLCVCFGTGSF